MSELYIEARRVLLDGLDALGPHRDAVVLVGAQAIYLRVGEADLAIAPYTTDGDLVVDTVRLSEIPPLETALRAANFRPESTQSVGVWVTTRTISTGPIDVAIDLLVPAPAGTSSRAANLTGHDRKVARNVVGLDGALVDNDQLQIKALDPDDKRVHGIRVAGPAALLVAKLHKIADRVGGKRLSDKDALDVVRLLRGVETSALADRYRRLLATPDSKACAARGLELLRELFVAETGACAEMIRRGVGMLADPEELIVSARVLGEDLIDVV